MMYVSFLLLICCSFLIIMYCTALSVSPFRDLNNRSSEQNTIYERHVSNLIKKLQTWERLKESFLERKQLPARKDQMNKKLQGKLLKAHLTDTRELINILNEITSRVETFMIATNQSVPGSDSFSNQGHVYSKNLTTQIQYYFTLARSVEDVYVVCETGFNAGHSAALWLYSMPQIVYFAFDIGVMPWSNMSVSYMSALFGDRFRYIRGYSTDTMKRDNMLKLSCDLLSIDGDHYNIYKDLVHGRNISSRAAYVVIDDYVSENNIPTQWNMAVKEGWLATLDEHKDKYLIRNSPNDSYYKGWVLGQFVPIPKFYMYEYNRNKRLISRPIESAPSEPVEVTVTPEPQPQSSTVAQMDKVLLRRKKRTRVGKSSSKADEITTTTTAAAAGSS